MKEETKHIVICPLGGADGESKGGGKCLHCGDTHHFKTPVPIDEWLVEVLAFIDRHRACKEPTTFYDADH